MIEKGVIIYCNMQLTTIRVQEGRRRVKQKIVDLKETVFSCPIGSERDVLRYSDIRDRRLIVRTGLKEDLKVLKVEIIKKLRSNRN